MKPFRLIYLITTCSLLIACSDVRIFQSQMSNKGTQTVDPIRPTDNSIVSDSPLSVTVPLTCSSKLDFQQIPIYDSVSDFAWTQHGESIIFASQKQVKTGERITTWYQYDILNKSLLPVEKHIDATLIQLWAQLDAAYPGHISPYGNLVLYQAKKLGVTNPIVSTLKPIKIANVEGTVILSSEFDCGHVNEVEWSRDEDFVIFDCGYEGPSDIVMADIHSGEFLNLTEILGGVGVSGHMKLSPDESMLAFDNERSLYIVDLADYQTKAVLSGGSTPVWTQNSNKLYFFRSLEGHESLATNVAVYDVMRNEVTTLLQSPFQIIDNTEFNIMPGVLSLSPSGSEILFLSQPFGVWVAIWDPEMCP